MKSTAAILRGTEIAHAGATVALPARPLLSRGQRAVRSRQHAANGKSRAAQEVDPIRPLRMARAAFSALCESGGDLRSMPQGTMQAIDNAAGSARTVCRRLVGEETA